jgi:hypothetical protein
MASHNPYWYEYVQHIPLLTLLVRLLFASAVPGGLGWLFLRGMGLRSAFMMLIVKYFPLSPAM